jgi:putative endonuclease
MYYTYVLFSHKDGRWYTGSTGDRKARIQDHSQGRVESTRHRRPLELAYYEACGTEADARRRVPFQPVGGNGHADFEAW